MEIKDILIALVFFSMVTIGIAAFSGNLMSNYGVSFSEGYSSYQGYINRSSSFSQSSFQKILNVTQEKNILQIAWYSLVGTKDIMLQIVELPPIMTDLTTRLLGGLKVETSVGWLVAGVTTIVLIIVIFAILRMIFKVDV